MKRILSFLAVLLLLGTVGISAAAAETENSYSLFIKADGATDLTVAKGDVITVTMEIARPGRGDIDLYSIQDYICFDPTYLRFQEGSLSVCSENSEGADPLLDASAMKFSNTPIEYENRVYLSRVSFVPDTIPSGAVLVTFKLEAVELGKTKLTHDGVVCFDENITDIAMSAYPATITIEKGNNLLLILLLIGLLCLLLVWFILIPYKEKNKLKALGHAIAAADVQAAVASVNTRSGAVFTVELKADAVEPDEAFAEKLAEKYPGAVYSPGRITLSKEAQIKLKRIRAKKAVWTPDSWSFSK